MAKKYTDSTGTYVIVEKGDNLWNICKTYLGDATKYKEIASNNNISNPSLIYPNQKIYIDGTTQSSSSSSSSSNGVVVSGPNVMASDDTKLFATWTWSKENTTASYKIAWEYQLDGSSMWFIEDKTISVDQDFIEAARYDIYTIPTNAVAVRFKIKPIAEEETSDDSSESTPKWTQGWSSYKPSSTGYKIKTIFETISAPTVEIDENNKLTASLSNLDINATHIKFQIVKNDTSAINTSPKKEINDYGFVSYEYTVPAGNEYKVRCKAYKDSMESDWSSFSDNVPAMPSTPEGITVCKASEKVEQKYSVYLEWSKVTSAKTYDIEYTTVKDYFDNPSGETTTVSTTNNTTKFTVYGIGEGGEYFFRVRAVKDQVASGWTEPVSVKIGEAPEKPTTWSSTTTAIVGEALTLYWMHNSEDGSSQTKAQVKITANGVSEIYEVLYNDDDDDDNDYNGSYSVNTSGYSEGVELIWQVCTAGITGVYGDWSIERKVDIYAKPTLDLTVTSTFEIQEDGTVKLLPPEGGKMDILESFPFYVKAVAGPATQAPIGYHLSVSSNEIYETVDQLGNSKTVSSGEQLYSKYFDIKEPLLVEFSANNIDLENNVEYTITCTVAMDSGLTAEATSIFRVSWTDMTYTPNAEVNIDTEAYSAAIRPYCEDIYYEYHRVDDNHDVTTDVVDETKIESVYTTTGEEVLLGSYSYGGTVYYCIKYFDSIGNSIDPTYCRVVYSSEKYMTTAQTINKSVVGKAYTSSGEDIRLGMLNGEQILYCVVEKSTPVDDVTLSVYRREFDGAFTELATNISNDTNTFVTDPHPALDYARYRIVAKTKSTGAVSYYDLPNIPVGGKSIIIQWDEDWTTFNYISEDPMVQPSWSGSLLKLHYNIDVSDSNNPDVSHVKYIGRLRPVAYYGTQLGETSSWNVVIAKDDEETIYALRRLMTWMGDVYVREPSGTGYWANVKVSFGQTHKEVTIPVTLDITRVEGGI